MPPFTVITYYTPQFACFAKTLRDDCQRWGYSLHAEEQESEFETLIHAFDYKITFIREMLLRYGRVLWLDVECRIVSAIPEDWQSPLISTYKIGEMTGFSSGVLMLDESQLEFVELWMKYAKKYPQYPDDFVLDFLARAVAFDFQSVPLEFYDRQTTSPVARGLWQNEHTVIQHPTINRWPEPTRYRRAFQGKMRKRRTVQEATSRQRKGIYYRNFAGDFDRVAEVMRNGETNEYREAGWVFDPIHQRYAPEQFWPEAADDFTTKPRSFARSRDNFEADKNEFRATAMRRMRLDADDRRRWGQPNSRGSVASLFRGIFARNV